MNVMYKFATIKTGVLVEKSWSPSGEEDYYNRTTENYAFSSYKDAADWLVTDSAIPVAVAAPTVDTANEQASVTA